MRVFAFGGNRYAERARVGQWPEAFSVTAEFEDLYPLPFGRHLIAYGAGVRDGSPFLIVRERQSEEDRGGYAYTVLLDPGTEVWERFGFNGARLLLAARQQRAFWSELVTTPNVLATPAIIAERLLALSADPVSPARPAAAAVTTKVKVAMLASIVGKTDVAVTARDLGCASRLSLEEMALALDGLPRALRTGLGWLMGGRPGTGVKFGCRLIVDDVAEEPLPGADAVMSLGAEAAYAIETVERNQLSETLQTLLDTPVHRWTADPARVVEQCRLLAVLASEGLSAAHAGLLAIGPDDPLYADVRRAASTAITSMSVTLPADVSEWALASYGGPTLVPREIVHRTDTSTLARYLNQAGVTLASPALKHYALPDDAALAVWCAQIAAARPDNTPDLLHDALKHLLTKGLSHAVVHERVARVSQVALQRGTEGGLPVRTWLRFKTHARAWTTLSALVASAARKRVAAGRDDWALDYLLCAGDDAAEWLRAEHGLEAVDQAITTALAYLRDRDAGARAYAWLDSLAGSPVRRELNLRQKLLIAEAAGGRWLSLSQLCQLLRGDRFLPARQPDAAEALALTGELRELVAGTVHGIPPIDATIDLERIAWLVRGAIPGDVADVVSAGFVLDAAAVKWLRAQAHMPAFETAVRRDWRTLPPELLRDVRPPALVRILTDIRAASSHDEQLRNVRALSARMPHEALAAVVESRPDIQTWLADLAGDPRLDAATSDDLLAALPSPLRSVVFARLVADDRKRFEDLVAKLIASDRTPAIGADLYRFIVQDEGLREELTRSLLGQPWGAASSSIAARLSPLPDRWSGAEEIDREGEAADEDLRGAEAESSWRAWFRRLWFARGRRS